MKRPTSSTALLTPTTTQARWATASLGLRASHASGNPHRRPVTKGSLAIFVLVAAAQIAVSHAAADSLGPPYLPLAADQSVLAARGDG